MTAATRVRELAAGESLKPFIDLAWTFNAADPAWVPPLRMVVKGLLSKKHPFHEHADVAYFLAERDGRTVGRVAAIVNHRHNEYHGERTGFFGFFECEDRAETAGMLLDAAAAWVKARGMERVRGPMNFSTNEECGLLVDGFETPPTVMMTHNPRYYPALVEGAGFHRAKDLLAYFVPSNHPPERLQRGLGRLLDRAGVTLRSIRMKDFHREVSTVMDVYNSAWQHNWGFVPMTPAEFEYMAKELKPVVDPELCLLAEDRNGQAVGFSLALPDLNQALRHLPDGRLLPFGIFKLLYHQRRIRQVRMITLGFRPGWQHLGLGAALYLRTFQVGARKGFETGEASWILDDNWEMRRALEKVGAHVWKTYRVYDRELLP